MSQSAGRAHTCAGQTTLDAQDTGALLSLVSLALCFLHRLCHTSQTDVLTLCANVLLSSPFLLLQCSFATAGVHTLFTPLHSSQPCKLSPPGHLTSAQVSPRDTQTHSNTHTSLEDCPPLALIVRCPTPIPDHHPHSRIPQKKIHIARTSAQCSDRRHTRTPKIIMAARSHHPSRALPLSRLTGAIASRDDHHHHFRALAAQTRPPERTAAAGCPPSRPSPKSRRACRQGCC